MSDKTDARPDNTAERVALWRALHVLADAPPHVIEDRVGLELAGPPEGWRDRPDMNPEFTKMFRASIVARARFIEDLVLAELGKGVQQYVLLGAGLDSFAQRRPEVAAKLSVFEVDQPGPQAWKRQRLIELGYGVAAGLRLVPVDFEAGEPWTLQLAAAGFDAAKPAVVTSTGVSMYLTKQATAATLREVASLAPGSTLVMSFLVPAELSPPEERTGREASERGAKANKTPFISFFTPDEITALARDAGFERAHVVPPAEIVRRYFAGRTDGLNPGSSEQLLVAAT
jgi:methyltransferase (TIGR00027 family)